MLKRDVTSFCLQYPNLEISLGYPYCDYFESLQCSVPECRSAPTLVMPAFGNHGHYVKPAGSSEHEQLHIKAISGSLLRDLS